MRYYNLGTCSKPCGILKWRGLTIMLDCSLDLTPVLNYLPLPLVGNSKFNNAPRFQNYQTPLEEEKRNSKESPLLLHCQLSLSRHRGERQELSELNGYLMVDSTPLFGVPTETSIDISEIDVILVSNSGSILALPYFTENPRFKGSVYATEPVINIGKFFMEELVDFVQSVPKQNENLSDSEKRASPPLCPPGTEDDEPSSSTASGSGTVHNGTERDAPNVFKLLQQTTLNFPIKLGNPCFNKNLREIYTKKSISDALIRVKIVGFNENTDVFGKLVATAVSSGFSLGSCNWVFKSENKKVAYVTSSSTLTTHPSQMEQAALKECDIFILSGLTQAPTHNPDSMMGEICMTVVSTLRSGGNVIFPCYPSGIIYDLFECLANHLDSTGYGTYPFYFVAPQSETSLAYSNILAEWLSNNKQRKVYLPEDPFPHAELAKNGRLKHYKVLHEMPEVRQPCIFFCGHPCLRFGDIVHMVETWGHNHTNTIIFTEAEFPYIECLLPFQPLAMKAVYFPIDTSLNFHQANKLIKDLKPKLLVTHEEYLVPPKQNPSREDLIIDYHNIEKLTPGCLMHFQLTRDTVLAHMDPKMAHGIDPTTRNVKGLYASTITTCLNNVDNKNRLVKTVMDACDPWKTPPIKYTWGSLDSHGFMERLGSEGFEPTIQNTANGFTVTIPKDGVTIKVEGTSTHIVCDKDDAGSMRVKLRRILTSCLTEF